VIVTTLISVRIWYLSPRKAHKMGSAQFPTRTGRAAIDIVVESGMLYLAVQFVFVILFAIRHPAQGIVGVIAVQIYVRIPHPWKAENSSQNNQNITQGIAPTLILIRVALGVSNMQNGPIYSGPPSSVSHPTSSTQVRVTTLSYMEPGSRLQIPAEKMSVSEIKSNPSSGDMGSALSSVENVAVVTV